MRRDVWVHACAGGARLYMEQCRGMDMHRQTDSSGRSDKHVTATTPQDMAPHTSCIVLIVEVCVPEWCHPLVYISTSICE